MDSVGHAVAAEQGQPRGGNQSRFHTAGIVGLGLIGGSLALALKKNTAVRVAGFDRDARALSLARERGAIEGQGDARECDILFIALYPKAAVDWVRESLPALRPGALVVDLCGIKRYPCGALGPLCRENGLHYIGAHPMAGRECSGFDNALPTLFEGASLILTPDESFPPDLLRDLEGLMRQAGFAQFVHTSPEKHDEMIAYTSQLAHVLSSAYIQNPLAEEYSGFTGGSFQDLTRVSRLNPQMWGELFERNSDYLCDQLDALIQNLCDYKQALQQRDSARLFALMQRGTQIKETLLRHAPKAPDKPRTE